MRVIHRGSMAVATALVGLVACASESHSGKPVPSRMGADAVAHADASDAPAAVDARADRGLDGGADGAPSRDAADDARADASAGDAGAVVGGADADSSCELDGPEILATGTGAALLLRGVLLLPAGPQMGEVLILGSTIACAAASCAGSLGASTATVVDTHGIVLPGLIDTHNHILFDVFDETDWTPTKVYTNHNQWTSEPRYQALVNAKQYLNGESGSPWDFGCEMDKYGELKGLVAGTTSIVGAANPANRACYGSLARTIDQSSNGLASDHIQVATLFPSATSANGVCTNFGTGSTDAYVIHIAEGVDSTARAELGNLLALTTPAGCLLTSETTIVHGTALIEADFEEMAAAGTSLTWSPRSNVFLYGGGGDLTKTTQVPLALAHGVNVSIAPDWSIGGSQNMLDELRFAHQVDVATWGGTLSSRALFEMVTANPARALGLADTIGALTVGLRADIAVISGDIGSPYDALLSATPREVRLVLVDGVPLYGDASLLPLAAASSAGATCETIDACCGSKFACVARASVTSGDKLDQSFAAIQTALVQALSDYDAMGLSPYAFAPLTPLIRCAP